MKNVKVSAVISALFLVIAIVLAVCIGNMCKQAEGVDTVEKLLVACEKRSASSASSLYYSIFTPSYDNCVTVEDYLSSSGITFEYMENKNCKTQKIYVLGTSEKTVEENDESYSNVLLNNYLEPTGVYIASEYTDEKGASQTAVIKVEVSVNDSTGQIISIM